MFDWAPLILDQVVGLGNLFFGEVMFGHNKDNSVTDTLIGSIKSGKCLFK